MQILNSLLNPGADVFYSVEFRDMIEDHLSWLKTVINQAPLTIESQEAYMFVGDLDGLLVRKGVSPHLHWVVMRLNNMTSPADYREDMLELLVPEADTIEQLRSTFLSMKRLKT